MTAYRLVFALLTGLAGAGGCTPFDSLKEACVSASYPVRSRVPNGSGAIDIVVAVRELDFGDRYEDGAALYTKLGFDLDESCGPDGARHHCTPPPWATRQPDGPDGRDNSVGRYLYALVMRTGATFTEGANTTSDSGLITTIIRVRNYNGSSDDKDVEVDWFAVTRIPLTDGGLAQPLRPEWSGRDEWYPLAEFTQPVGDDDDGGVAPSIEAKYVDREAYVTDHVLVARFEELLTIMGTYSHVVLTAKLEQREQGWTLTQGTAGARMRVDDMLAILESHIDDETNAPVCTNTPSYRAFKDEVCSLADVSSRRIDDPSEICDAVSWAWRFEAHPAVLLDVPRRELVPPPPCPAAVAPRNDHCDPDASIAELTR